MSKKSLFQEGFGTYLVATGVVLLLSFSFVHCAPVECKQSVECSNGGLCVDGKCKPRPTTPCATDKDCGALERCADKKCVFVPPSSEPEVGNEAGEPSTPEKQPDGIVGPDGPVPVGSPCVFDGNCGAGVCQVSFNKGKVVKECVIPKKSKDGVRCKASAECASGLCSTRFGFCVSLCFAHRHCPATQFCEDTPYLQGNTVGGCVKGPRNDCTGDEDCPKGQFCQANFDPRNGAASLTCGPPEGKDKEPPGSACTPDEFPGKCASHICDKVLKKCLEVCKPGLKCQEKGYECQVLPYLKSEVMSCYPPPKACEKQADCPAATTFCHAELVNDTPAYRCLRDSIKRAKKLGETCDPAEKAPGSCQSGICYPTAARVGYCVSTCKADADCKDSPNTKRCGKLRLGPNKVLVRACVPENAPCQDSATCPDSQPLCRLELINSKIERRCGEARAGTKKVGEACTINTPGVDNTCANRFCEPGTKRCLAVCLLTEQCPKGQACRQTRIGSHTVKGCVYPKDAVCTKQQDCIFPETCQINEETDKAGKLVLVGRCKTATGRVAYSACGSNGEGKLSPGCASNICLHDDQVCAPPCTNDDQCFGLCKEITLLEKKQKVCRIVCAHQSECGKKQDCNAALLPAGVRGLCRPEDTKKKAEGDACEPKDGFKGVCRSGLCSIRTKTCLTFCRENKDCKANQLCASPTIGGGVQATYAVKACVDKAAGACGGNNQCALGTICKVIEKNNLTYTDCVKPTPGKATNDACTPASGKISTECVSGFCDEVTKTCSVPCDSDADCNNVRPKCGNVTINGTTLKACTKVPAP